jgi:hypothetical protein
MSKDPVDILKEISSKNLTIDSFQTKLNCFKSALEVVIGHG